MSKVTMGNKSKFKIQRRLDIELPGLGKAGALEKRAFAPGQHGQNMRRKVSDYGIRFKEKQKVLFHYGLRETQLRKLIKKSKRDRSREWVDTLIGKLERRLDNIVFRLGFAPSMAAARQLVSHGHIVLNGKKADIPSMMLNKGDKIGMTAKGYNSSSFIQSRSNPRLEMPDYLGKVIESGNPVGLLNEIPGVLNIPFAFEKRYFIEHYGKL